MNPRYGGPDRRPQPFHPGRPARTDRPFGSDRPPGRPERPEYRSAAPGAGRPPGPGGPDERAPSRYPGRPEKERLTFRPDGTSEVNMRTERGPRPGRVERDSIRRGERPFWDGNSAGGPEGRPQSDRPQYDRPQGDRPQYDRPQGDRPQYDRPRPQYSRPAGGYRGSDRPDSNFNSGSNSNPNASQDQGPNWSPRPRSTPGSRPPYGGGGGGYRGGGGSGYGQSSRGYGSGSGSGYGYGQNRSSGDDRNRDRDQGYSSGYQGTRPPGAGGPPRPGRDRDFARPAYRPPQAAPARPARDESDEEEDRLDPRTLSESGSASAPAPRRPARPEAPRPFYDRFIKRKPPADPNAAPKPKVRAAGVAPDRAPEPVQKPKPAKVESTSTKPARINPKPAPQVRAALKAAADAAKAKASAVPGDGGTPRTVPEIIERILSKIGPDLAADAALRQELKRRRSLAPEAAAHISLSVFRNFRWQGWLSPESTPELRVAQAHTLAEQFASRPDSIPDAELMERTVPAWTREAMDYDIEWLRALQREPSLWVRTRADYEPALVSRFASGDLGPLTPGPLPQSYSYAGTVDLFRLKEFQEGQFEIQDIASQAVGHLCDPKPGEIWWDTCAGEGGKTLHLADRMGNRGLIYATDRADWRLARLRERAGRAECFNYRAAHWDGGERPPTQSQFDGILVDAPCSGIGTWGKNPHARWTTTPTDVSELAAVQHSMLKNVAPAVKLGGRLVYAVCTLSRAETTEVAEAFAKAHPDFEPIPLRNPFTPDVEPTGNQVTLWPQQTGGNGMYVAAWKRVRAAMAPSEA